MVHEKDGKHRLFRLFSRLDFFGPARGPGVVCVLVGRKRVVERSRQKSKEKDQKSKSQARDSTENSRDGRAKRDCVLSCLLCCRYFVWFRSVIDYRGLFSFFRCRFRLLWCPPRMCHKAKDWCRRQSDTV